MGAIQNMFTLRDKVWKVKKNEKSEIMNESIFWMVSVSIRMLPRK